MNREEAIAKGVKVNETCHSMKRRRPSHNYNRVGTYMLTLVVEGRRPLLGVLKPPTTLTHNQPYVEPSVLGTAILNDEIAKIRRYYPMLRVWKVCLMPDHIHMIVRIVSDMPTGKHLGYAIAGFKTGCNRAYWQICHMTTPPLSPLFEKGYNDKILMNEGQLDKWKAYLDDNPRRLFLKRQNPHLFTVLHDMDVAGCKCQIVGNQFLLDIPDKMAVIVHRRYTDVENARLRERWLACGERGGVLVSAAIAPKEQAVLREAMNCGYRIILLRENGFPQLYKPSGESFDACAAGLLLQISPWPFHMERKTITRAQCLDLNTLAERIAAPE